MFCFNASATRAQSVPAKSATFVVGRADKGLFITTGTFTTGAIKEATRDGAPPIDLVDGDELADKLKELSLGVVTEMVPRVVVKEEWFGGLAVG